MCISAVIITNSTANFVSKKLLWQILKRLQVLKLQKPLQKF